MKERPILFSAPMVRAILEWRKTQTRRVINRHPLIDCGMSDAYIKHPDNHVIADCKYGRPGDRLWVRETFSQTGRDLITYRADNITRQLDFLLDTWLSSAWRPSIFMPRWASRITLEITGVRVERVQEITHNDACIEGAPSDPELNNRGTGSIYIDWYADLWDKLNAKNGYSWASNPLVWVISFSVVKP
jgi:hypothetical protein